MASNQKHANPVFQSWLDKLSSDYKNLTDEERNETLAALIKAGSCRQLHYLQTTLNNLVYRDLIRHLPREIVEYILKLLDPISLLICCQVCTTWNNFISNTTSIWYDACIDLDLQLNTERHELSAKKWKQKFLYMSNLLSKMKNYNACKNIYYRGHAVRVTAAYYWRNKLATAADDHSIRIWDTQQDTCETIIPTECSISSIKFDNNVLIMASYAGNLKSFCWKSTNHLKDFAQHTAAVFSLDYNFNHDLLISGGADDTIRTWSISKGQMWSALRGHNHWVLTVILVSTEIDDQMLLLSMDRHEIRIWPVILNIGPPYDIKCNQRISTSLSNFNFFTPGLHCDSKFVYFIKQDPAISGVTLFCCWDIENKTMKYQHTLQVKVKNLLGVGKKYFCIMCPLQSSQHPNFLVFSHKTKKPVLKWFVPASRPSSPGNAQMILCETNWLDGLTEDNHDGTIFVTGLEDCSFYVLKWFCNSSTDSFHTAASSYSE